jgi:SRSO17 transposase
LSRDEPDSLVPSPVPSGIARQHGSRTANDSESRFAGNVEGLVRVIGHADRAGLLRDYCVGLMLLCERKSVEPMAAVTAPERTAAAANFDGRCHRRF